MTLKLTKPQTKTRLLLALYVLNGVDVEINKSDLTRRVRRKGEDKDDYVPLYKALVKDGAIVVTVVRKKPLWEKVKLTEAGRELLMAGLQDQKFAFDANVGARVANMLLEMARRNGATAVANGKKNGKGAIASYDDFKPVVLETYDRLNRDYNLDNLVPIYRIRREIGERVERANFSEWMFAMQSDDLLKLLEESVEDGAMDKLQDSVTNMLGKLRCYATRPKLKA
jgi:hypothetical protein